MAGKTGHHDPCSALRTALWQARGRGEVAFAGLFTAGMVGPPSRGDGIDRSATNPQSHGDFSL